MGRLQVTERASQLDFQKLVHVLKLQVFQKRKEWHLEGKDLGIMVQNCTRETSLKVQWLGILPPLQGVWTWFLVGELQFHMPCGQNKTTKLHKKQKGRWRNFLLTASNTWTLAPLLAFWASQDTQTRHFFKLHLPTVSDHSLFWFAAEPAWILSDSGIFSKLPLLAGCETERNMPIILFFPSVSLTFHSHLTS